MRKIAVLTSGGDAPGMNAAIRAVVRAGIHQGWQMWGVRNGFVGLMNGEFTSLDARSVGGIMQQGGTVLGTARAPQFKTAEGRAEALQTIRSAHWWSSAETARKPALTNYQKWILKL